VFTSAIAGFTPAGTVEEGHPGTGPHRDVHGIPAGSILKKTFVFVIRTKAAGKFFRAVTVQDSIKPRVCVRQL
jgi:hypothetical protein